MAKIITAFELKELATVLAKDRKVIAPSEFNGYSASFRFSFEDVNENNNFRGNYPVTILPPKEFLLPPEEILFEFNKKGEIQEPKKVPFVLFGLSREDLEGIFYLTEIFSKPVADEPFLARKKETILVACDKYSPPKDIPFDLYLMEIFPEKYAAFAGSKEGQKILKNPLFKEQPAKIPTVERPKDKLVWDPKTWEAVEKSKDHPVWKELARKCFGCGICSYACPLCFCFDMEDKSEFGTGKTSRCRNWSSCMLKSFAETNAGNFREEAADRIYNWYFHKFVRMPAEYGFPGCTGCNRCLVYCPAKINYREVLERVTKDYKKRGKK